MALRVLWVTWLHHVWCFCVNLDFPVVHESVQQWYRDGEGARRRGPGPLPVTSHGSATVGREALATIQVQLDSSFLQIAIMVCIVSLLSRGGWHRARAALSDSEV
eukprot:3604468-Rhodomonas_salina.8